MTRLEAGNKRIETEGKRVTMEERKWTDPVAETNFVCVFLTVKVLPFLLLILPVFHVLLLLLLCYSMSATTTAFSPLSNSEHRSTVTGFV